MGRLWGHPVTSSMTSSSWKYLFWHNLGRSFHIWGQIEAVFNISKFSKWSLFWARDKLLKRPDKHRDKDTNKHTGWKHYHLANAGDNNWVFFIIRQIFNWAIWQPVRAWTRLFTPIVIKFNHRSKQLMKMRIKHKTLINPCWIPETCGEEM